MVLPALGRKPGKEPDLQGQVVHAGSTPVRALGATDQHSQLQLYMEGPQDKLITFLEVEKFKHQLEIPNLYPDQEELSYLGGHSLDELSGHREAGHGL